MHITVLRLESTEDGFGPFSHCLSGEFNRIAEEEGLAELGDGECYHDRFPTPQEEPELAGCFSPDHCCAFADAAQARAWFSPRMVALLAVRDFRLRTYRVPADGARAGAHQVIFERDRARLIADDCPTTLYA